MQYISKVKIGYMTIEHSDDQTAFEVTISPLGNCDECVEDSRQLIPFKDAYELAQWFLSFDEVQEYAG